MTKHNFPKTKTALCKMTLLFSCILLTGAACKKTSLPQDTVAPKEQVKAQSEVTGDFTTLAFNSPIKLFDGGSGVYHSYRIPSIIRTKKGTLIAFCEGRVDNNRDYGNINLICRRSTTDGSG